MINSERREMVLTQPTESLHHAQKEKWIVLKDKNVFTTVVNYFKELM